MRSTLIIGLSFLLAPEAIGADKPIPQDAEGMEKHRREWAGAGLIEE